MERTTHTKVWQRNLSMVLLIISSVGVCLLLRAFLPEFKGGATGSKLLMPAFILAIWFTAAALHYAKKYVLSIFAVLGLACLYVLWMAVISGL